MTLTLPASKTDQRALGVGRCHACICTHGIVTNCPVHAVWDQLLLLQQEFPHLHQDGVPHRDLPLFPNVKGASVTKTAMVGLIAHAASLLGVPSTHQTAISRYQGIHCGAQVRKAWPRWALIATPSNC